MQKRQQLHTEIFFRPVFTIIRGGKDLQTQIDKLVSNAWNFSFTALWNNASFSEKEIAAAQAVIREFISAYKKPEKGYKDFCQRVLLARNYISGHAGRYIPLPSVWLNKENSTGFAGTKKWYKDILAVRSSLPDYKIELKALAEAVLEMQDESTSENYIYWRNYFLDKKAPGLLMLFQAIVANQQYL